MKIIGLARKTGKYEGKDYDNMVITCTGPYPLDAIAEGEYAETIKVKTTLFEEYDLAIGDDIAVLYDKFGRVVQLVRKE